MQNFGYFDVKLCHNFNFHCFITIYSNNAIPEKLDESYKHMLNYLTKYNSGNCQHTSKILYCTIMMLPYHNKSKNQTNITDILLVQKNSTDQVLFFRHDYLHTYQHWIYCFYENELNELAILSKYKPIKDLKRSNCARS